MTFRHARRLGPRVLAGLRASPPDPRAIPRDLRARPRTSALGLRAQPRRVGPRVLASLRASPPDPRAIPRGLRARPRTSALGLRAQPRRVGPRVLASLASACALAALATGCATTEHPGPILAGELAEAQTFPYYRIYWTGPRFQGQPLVAADGRRGYNSEIGDSVYYGDCVEGKGVFGGGGTCQLPLQVTTVIYRLHANQPLGPQRNMLIRGVPATVYDEGRSIELYSGRLAIDIFSDSFTNALAAADELRPLNASGSATTRLPPPVFCPVLYGPQEPELEHTMNSLPGHPCQQNAAELAFAKQIHGHA